MSERRVIQVQEKVPFLKALPLSFQHLFAMFGASVLVPFLFNNSAKTHYVTEVLKTTFEKLTPDQLTQVNAIQVIDPALVLLLNGIGTLLFIFLCKGKAPAFLGSSFAFLAPTGAIIASSTDYKENFSAALGGFILCGLVFVVVALIIGKVGTRWLDIVLPPAAMGPIVALIGLELSGTAADMAKLFPVDGVFDTKGIVIAMVTLAIAILGSLCFRGFLSIIPILCAVVVGYVLAAIMGYVDYSSITAQTWFNIPAFTAPSFKMNALLIMAPAALVVLSEHIGHVFVTSNIVGKDLTKDPGLHRTLLGDGISTALSGFCGSCPTTTYGENMGVMAITRVYSVWVIGGAGAISILIAFVGKLSGVISSIPGPVMGGISILLFGVIAASGIRMIVESKIDYSKSKNLILTAVVFVIGISGVSVNLGENIQLKGMVLATLVGIALSLVFYILEKAKLTNDAN